MTAHARPPAAPRHRAAARARRTLRHARQRAADHPRHVLLAALTAGLLAGPRWPIAVAAIALLAVALAPGALMALASVAMLLLGAGLADTRLAALDRSTLGPLLDREASVRATLLDHPRTRAFGTR